MVEFEVGDRARRCPNGLTIHANHEADQRLGVGERFEDVFALIVQGGSADLDKSHVICTSIEDQLLQPSGIQRLLLWRNGRHGLEANPPRGRMIFELHGCSLLYIQLCGEKTSLRRPWFNCSTILSPRTFMTCCCASLQAGTAFSRSLRPWGVSRKGCDVTRH